MKPLLRNVLVIGAADIAARLAGFVTTVYLARVLGPAAFGVVTIGASVLIYCSLIASPGIQQVEARNAARPSFMTPERVDAILSLRMLLALLLIPLLAVVLLLAGVSGETGQVILAYALSLVPLALALDWWFQGKERFGAVGAFRLATALVYGTLAILLVRGPGDLRTVPFAFLGGNIAATTALLVLYARGQRAPLPRLDPAEARRLVAENAPVGFAVFLGQSIVNLPPIVLGVAAGDEGAGVYAAAAKILVVVLLLDRLFNALFLPAVTRKLATSREEAAGLVRLSLKAVLAVMLPVAVVLAFAAPVVMAAVFGDAYGAAAPVLAVLLWYCVLTLLNSLFSLVLMGSGREALYTRAMVIGSVLAALFVVAGAVLGGAPGAATGVVAGEALTAWLMLRNLEPDLLRGAAPSVFRPVAGGLLMAAAGFVALPYGAPAASAAALAVYAVYAPAAGLFHADEIRWLRERII